MVWHLTCFLFTAHLFFGPVARAEYRVFLLEISTPNADPKLPPSVRKVESTLDPEQYLRYNTVKPNEIVSYQHTWRCFGRTDNHQAFCPNPKSAPQRNPSSEQGPELQAPTSAKP